MGAANFLFELFAFWGLRMQQKSQESHTSHKRSDSIPQIATNIQRIQATLAREATKATQITRKSHKRGYRDITELEKENKYRTNTLRSNSQQPSMLLLLLLMFLQGIKPHVKVSRVMIFKEGIVPAPCSCKPERHGVTEIMTRTH